MSTVVVVLIPTREERIDDVSKFETQRLGSDNIHVLLAR